MKKLSKKITAILLACLMVLGAMPSAAFAADEAPVCVCTALCEGGNTDMECPVCAVNPEQCAFMQDQAEEEPQAGEEPAEPEQPTCICTALCGPETVNAECPACAADPERCAFVPEQPAEVSFDESEELAEEACICTALCGAETVNTECPVCAEDFSLCMPLTDEAAGKAALSASDYPMFDTEEELYTNLREVIRQRKAEVEDGGYAVYIEPELAMTLTIDEIENAVFDLSAERDGMRPDEGDYMYYNLLAINTSKGGYEYQGYIRFRISVTSTTTLEQEQQVDAKVQSILDGALASVADSASNEEKAKAAFDWIRSHVSSSGGDRTDPIKHTAYNAFINGNATCQGYALAYGRLLRELGVPNRVIMGVDANAHTYNIVLMDDGYYYYVDASAGIFKKTYTTFSRAAEQTRYTTPAFVRNYISHIKDYNVDCIATVRNDSNDELYEAPSLVDARAYIVEKVEAAQNAGNTPPHYTVTLQKNVTAVSKGELDFTSFADDDSSMSQCSFYSSDYSAYVTVDLNGKTITVRSGTDYLLRASSVINGTIAAQKNGWIGVAGGEDSTSVFSGVAFKGAGSTELLGVYDNTVLDSTCTVTAFRELEATGTITVEPAISVKEILFGVSFDTDARFSSLTTNTLNYQNTLTLQADTLTVNSYFGVVSNYGFNFPADAELTIGNSLTLKGTILACGGDEPLRIVLKKSGDSIAKMNLSGTLTCTNDFDEAVVPVTVAVEAEEEGGSVKLPMNTALGTLSLKAVLTEGTAAVAVTTANVRQVLAFDKEEAYRSRSYQTLYLSGTSLVYGVDDAVSRTACNALKGIAASSDVSLTFNLATPAGITLTDKYYYAISLVRNASTIADTGSRSLNTAVHFLPALDENGDPTTSATLYAFVDGDGNEITESGKGAGCKMDVIIRLVLTEDGVQPASLSAENVISCTPDSNVGKLANVSTKAPYYADKIKLKTVSGSVYSGRVTEVAQVDLGADTTYISTDDWTATGPEGFTFIRQTEDPWDTGVYFDVDASVAPGKYTVTVATTPGEGRQPASAEMTVTVLPTVSVVTASAPATVFYQKPGSALSVKLSVAAYNQNAIGADEPKAEDSIKKAKFIYYLYDVTDPEAPELITDKNIASVAANGTVTVAKNSAVTGYRVEILPEGGYIGEEAPSASVTFRVQREKVVIGSITPQCFAAETGELQTLSGPDAKGAWSVSYSELLAQGSLSQDNPGITLLVADAAGNTIDPSLYTVTCSDKNWLNASAVTKPLTVTYTVKTIDGASQKVKVNIGYSDNNYSRVMLAEGTGAEGSAAQLINSGEAGEGSALATKENPLDLTANPTSTVYTLWLADEAGAQAKDDLFLASLKIDGGKSLRAVKNQYIEFTMTKSLATITATWGTGASKVTQKYFLSNANFTRQAAPALKQQGTVYSAYNYGKADSVTFTLNNPVKGVDGKTVPAAANVAVAFDKVNTPAEIIDMFESPVYTIVTDAKGKQTAVVTLAFRDGQRFEKAGSYKLYFNFSDSTSGSILTKAAALGTLKVVGYKTSGALNASYTIARTAGSTVSMEYKEKGTFKTGYTVRFDSISSINEKGTYNNFIEVFNISTDGTLTLDNADAIKCDAKGNPVSCVGYVTYTVTYPGGLEVTHSDKITVKFAK